MANGIARARLRPGRDDDIQAALDDATRTQDESDVVRAALRLYFGLEGQDRVPRQRQQPIERPARPGPLKVVKPKLVATDKKDMSQDTNTALDTLLGF
jgi:Arc/MetJ-type ribon-helix-helix transcriptional regulator